MTLIIGMSFTRNDRTCNYLRISCNFVTLTMATGRGPRAAAASASLYDDDVSLNNNHNYELYHLQDVQGAFLT